MTEQQTEQTEPDEQPDLEPDETPGLEPDEQPEPVQTPEPAPETPQSQGRTEQEWEERFKKLDKAVGNYVSRVGAILEEDASELVPCTLCGASPWPGFLHADSAGKIPAEAQALTMQWMGVAREQDYRQDPETKTCDTCAGEGKTATGSHVPDKRTRTCPTCKGFGYTPPPTLAPEGNGHREYVPVPGELPMETVEQPERDAWGEPRILPDGRENPNYGKMPQFKIQVEPWGATAHLTAQDATV